MVSVVTDKFCSHFKLSHKHSLTSMIALSITNATLLDSCWKNAQKVRIGIKCMWIYLFLVENRLRLTILHKKKSLRVIDLKPYIVPHLYFYKTKIQCYESMLEGPGSKSRGLKMCCCVCYEAFCNSGPMIVKCETTRNL